MTFKIGDRVRAKVAPRMGQGLHADRPDRTFSVPAGSPGKVMFPFSDSVIAVHFDCDPMSEEEGAVVSCYSEELELITDEPEVEAPPFGAPDYTPGRDTFVLAQGHSQPLQIVLYSISDRVWVMATVREVNAIPGARAVHDGAEALDDQGNCIVSIPTASIIRYLDDAEAQYFET